MAKPKNDITDKRFGNLVAKEFLYYDEKYRDCWRFECDCGNVKVMPAANVKWGRVQSCGCLQLEYIKNLNKQNIKDKQFGRLTAVKPTNKRDSSGSIIWECLCECGSTVYYSVNVLNKGSTQSCGCLYQESRKDCVSNRKDIFDNTSVTSLITKKNNQRNNSTGFRGIYLDRRVNKWVGYINFKKKRYYLGSFVHKEDAIQARINAEQKLYIPFILENWDNLSEFSKNHFKDFLMEIENQKSFDFNRRL